MVIVMATVIAIVILVSLSWCRPGGYDKGVSVLNTHHQGDMAKVAADIFAHYYTSGRNALAVKLIVSGRGFRAGNLCNGDNLSTILIPPPLSTILIPPPLPSPLRMLCRVRSPTTCQRTSNSLSLSLLLSPTTRTLKWP